MPAPTKETLTSAASKAMSEGDDELCFPHSTILLASVCLYVCLYVCLSVCLSVCLPVCLSVCLSVSVCLSLCLSVSLCLCLSWPG